MRRPTKSSLEKLALLTRARELAARSDLARITAKRRQLEQRICDLSVPPSSAGSLEDAIFLERWQSWRKQETQRSFVELAALMADHALAQRAFGTAMAKNEIVGTLHRRVTKGELQTRERRALESSHLLTNNVGYEDV